jgi:ABC-type uncharacterized transport system ATPase subunit
VKQGVGVIHVTHRLREVFAYCNTVTVFRDGQNVGTVATADTDMPNLVSMIVGPKASIADELMAMEADASAAATEEVHLEDQHSELPADLVPVLELRDVHNEALNGVSLVVEPGEIVRPGGVVGAAGPPRSWRPSSGLRRVDSGEMLLNGTPQRLRSPGEAIAHGIGLVPEDRHEQGLVLDHSIDSNLSLPILKSLTQLGTFKRRISWRRSGEIMKTLSVKATTAATPLTALSGGNQQKVVSDAGSSRVLAAPARRTHCRGGRRRPRGDLPGRPRRRRPGHRGPGRLVGPRRAAAALRAGLRRQLRHHRRVDRPIVHPQRRGHPPPRRAALTAGRPRAPPGPRSRTLPTSAQHGLEHHDDHVDPHSRRAVDTPDESGRVIPPAD